MKGKTLLVLLFAGLGYLAIKDGLDKLKATQTTSPRSATTP
jgi:hypothetical protein